MTTETLVETAKNFLKSNIFQFDKKSFKTVTRYSSWYYVCPVHGILFMADLEERVLEEIKRQPYI